MTYLLVILLPILSLVFLPLKRINKILFYTLVCSLGLTNVISLLFNLTKFEKIDLGYLVFTADKYSCFFALIVNFAWIITTIYSFSFIKYGFQQKAHKFYFYLGIVLTIVLATGFAGNLITLFIFYVASIPFIYPLIILRDSPESHKAGRLYLKSTLLPAFLIFLPAVIITYQELGFFNFGDTIPETLKAKPVLAATLLMMFIIGMAKNCVIPFNNWLPRTMLAPAPISALVHSVAAVKSGSIALIKIAVYVYGLEFLQELTSKFFLAGYLTYLCGITAIYAAYKAFKVDDLKMRLSYSTVSQLSYIITAILIATPTAILGGILHILTHSVAKITLFFIAGFYNSVYSTTSVQAIRKIAPHTKWLVACFGICGFSIAGFPLFAGYFSKDLMLLEELHTGNYAAAIFLLAGSIMNIFYIAPLIQAGFWTKTTENFEQKPIPIGMKISITLCMLTLILLSFYTYYVIRMFEMPVQLH